ncbi:MAG TPA: transposase, partial [Albitalea sp.]|nr:transposase [Albitalea sp.]
MRVDEAGPSRSLINNRCQTTAIGAHAQLAAMDLQHVAQLLRSQAASNDALRSQVEALRAQIEWFKRQIFGQKSERYAPQPDAQQMHLGELMPAPA